MSRALRRAGRGVVALGLLVAAGLTGFVAAYVLRSYEGPAVDIADRLGEGVARRWNDAFGLDPMSPRNPEGMRLSSIFVPLVGRVVQLPQPDRQGEGGSLTSWGSDIVVITHDGAIWVVDGGEGRAGEGRAPVRTRIAPPFNGFEDYAAAAGRAPFDALKHDFKVFRYNDITAFEWAGERGLLVSYTRFHADRNCHATVVSRLDIDRGVEDLRDHAASAGDWEDVFETKPCLPFKEQLLAIEGHEAGGAIAFDGAGTLWLASGDYGWDGMQGPRVRPGADPETAPSVPQDPEADYGKVIAIDLDTGAARQVSRGHRNTQGIALDAEGRPWVTEHGPRGGDELNRIVEGGNYGWPLVAYGTRYAMLPLPEGRSFGRHAGFRRPMLAWLPSVGISGLELVRGFHEAWDGDLIAASLIGNRLVRLRVAEGRVVFAEEIATGRRIRQVHQHSDGRLVLWTSIWEVIFLEPAAASLGLRYVEEELDGMAGEAPVAEIRAAIRGCAECHSLDIGEHGSAPSLARVFGARVASTGFGGYSEALRAQGGEWTRERLAAYLRDPQAAVPGTVMPDPRLKDERVIEGVIGLLESLATVD